MQALQKTAPTFGVELRQVDPPPPPAADEVIIDVEAAGICGSDVHVYEWTSSYAHLTPALPLTLGHEFAGRIAHVGSQVTDFAPGDLVTVVPSIVCGTCAMCRAQAADRCTSRTSIGLMRPGAFAPQVAVPARNCIRLPEGVDAELGAITEPMTIGARAVESGDISANDRLLIMGPGPIGQAIAVMAREAGARDIVIVGKDDPERLACLRALGFAHTFDLADDTLAAHVRRVMGSEQFDVVFEATGVPATLQHGLDVLRPFGILVTCAIHATPASIDVTRLVRSQQQIRGSARGSRATWERVLEVLARRGDQLRPMITHRLPLDRALEGFEAAHHKRAAKVLLRPNA